MKEAAVLHPPPAPPPFEAVRQAVAQPRAAFDQVAIKPDATKSNEARFRDGHRQIAELRRGHAAFLAGLNRSIDGLWETRHQSGGIGLEAARTLVALTSQRVGEAAAALESLEAARKFGLNNPGTLPVRPLLKAFNKDLIEGATEYHDGMVEVYYRLLALAADLDPDSREIVASSEGADMDAVFARLVA